MASPTRLSPITKIQDNEDNLRLLVEQLRTPLGVIPFVGAGLSIPFGFPSWSEFLTTQADKASIRERVEQHLKSGEYEEAAEILLKKRGYRAFHDAIDNSFSDRKLADVRFRGAISILAHLAAGPVITTNFDHVIETAFKQADNEFQHVVWGVKADLATKALQQNRRFLLKIHGDSEDSTERILTKSDYEAQYCSPSTSQIDFARPLPRLLRQMLVSRPLLFLGCSLKQDRTVAVLEDVVQNDRSIAHYSVLERPPSPEEFLERSRFLSEHNIRPIWYPYGEHHWLETILTHLLEATATKSEPRIVKRTPSRSSAKRRSGRNESFTVLQLAQLYNFPDGLDGKGQCVALIELGGGYDTHDLETYFSTLRLPLPRISSVSVAGAKNKPTKSPNGPDAQVMMDIEVCGTIAPRAEIAVYFAPNTNQGFLEAIHAAVSDDVHRPSVISISWGGPESGWGAKAMDAMDREFQSAAAAGITVCCAAGDLGSHDGVQDGRAHVDFPASSPHVLACGGTRLTASGGMVTKEVVWNDSGLGGASGGGISEHFPMPTWQSGTNVPRSVNPGAPIGRGLPDVAANASPACGYQLLVDGQRVVMGGTAAVAPLWAGLIARINQGLGRRVGYFNPTLYTRIGPAGVFREIVDGNNSAGDVVGYQAGPGWNPCAGWGAPDGTHLLMAFRLLGDSRKS